MKIRTSGATKFVVIGVLAVAVILAFFLTGHKKDIGVCIEYKCDVKNLRLSTTIEIDKEGEDFARVEGKIFALFTDPLTMYDLKGNKIGYAGDAYHFITQDSHSIFVNDEISVEMVGLFNLLGESYDIYNSKEEKVAYVKFNAFNTNGEMYDTEGNLIADFNSKILMNDFEVRITEKCKFDEKTVLMIFCSYYSDQSADAKSASNSQSEKSG